MIELLSTSTPAESDLPVITEIYVRKGNTRTCYSFAKHRGKLSRLDYQQKNIVGIGDGFYKEGRSEELDHSLFTELVAKTTDLKKTYHSKQWYGTTLGETTHFV